MKRIQKRQSAFFNLRVLIGLLVVLAGVFLALMGFGAFPASPASGAKPQRLDDAQKHDPNAKSAAYPFMPAELICEDDGICVRTYPNFDNDLVNILARQDNTIRPVNAANKRTLINSVIAFAGTVGIPRQAIRRQPSGRLYGKNVVNQEIDAYFKQDPEPDLRASAVVKARKTTRFRTAVPPISDDQLKQIADGTLAQWHVPILVPGEALRFASHIHTREVNDTTDPRVITERVGYYRTFPGRQVVNSTLKVEIDPSTSLASGLSLRAFWPLLPPQPTALKSFAALKSDVLKALHKNGSRSLTLKVTSCSPTYYQAPAVLIPSVSCTGTFINSQGLNEEGTEGVLVDVSLASSYSLDESDEMSVFTSTYPDDSDMGGMKSRPDLTEPTGCAETSGFGFHAYYITDDDLFYDGAKEFYDEFDTSSRAANLGKAWHDSRFVLTPCDQYGADWSDLIFVEAHGNIRYFVAENDDPLDQIYTTSTATTDLTQLGTGDAEYLVNAGCLTGSVIYCYGRSAVTRYTEATAGWHAVFDGLHIYSGNNGLAASNSSLEKKQARTLSEYLNDGETIIEAWDDTNDDVTVWLTNLDDGCCEMTDPDNSCAYQTNDCSRWSAYASSFYQDGKEYVTLNNRGSYSDDIFPDDPDYDIDLRYEYQSETVPMYSPGHPLP